MKIIDKGYFIKKNYIARKKIEIKTGDYWNLGKISSFNLFQNYPAYNFCRRIVRKENINSVLDIGCGDALKLIKLIKSICPNVYGIDEKPVINFIKQYYSLKTFFSTDLNKNQLDLQRKFDLIICIDVIEHLIYPDELIKLIKKHSHEKTLMILSTPERDILRGKKAISPSSKKHIREWNKQEFANYIEYQGFIIIKHKIINLSRFIDRWKKPLEEIGRFLKKIKRLFFTRRLNRVKHTQIVLARIRNLN